MSTIDYEEGNMTARAIDASGGRPALSVVIPTRNEVGNVARLVACLDEALAGIRAEIIFVDDSDDDTPTAIAEAATASTATVALIHRPSDRREGGLGGAVVEGFAAARAPWICVMDGDLQHPPALVRDLLAHAQEGELDLVLASRFHDKQPVDGLSRLRAAASHTLIGAAQLLFPRKLRGVTDPLTGFFVVRRDVLELPKLRPHGFKILLEILVRTPSLRVGELPFEFGARYAGESKASVREAARYVSLLSRLRFGDLHARFGRFGVVGLSGLVVNTAALWAFKEISGFWVIASVILATQVSTLWNFGLTESWVFRGETYRHGFARRLAMFLAMNNAALVARVPMMALLYHVIGLNYLVANVISLLALTLLRFALADRMIWSSGRVETHRYSIHDIVTVASEVRLPELERFRVDELALPPKVNVRIGRVASSARTGTLETIDGIDHVRYREQLGRLGFGVAYEFGEQQTKVTASPLLRTSPHVLYTNCVEPLLRWTFVELGFSLIHAACVAFDGEAFLITAKTDTGKTTTILKTLDNHPCSFISDDLTLVHPDGRVLTYPKPLTISQHTLHAVKTPLLSATERFKLKFQSRLHSKEGRNIGMILAEKGLPAASMNALVQLMVPPPKYDIERLVPEVDVVAEAHLAGMVVIQRDTVDEQELLEPDEALDILMANCDDAYGFPPYPLIQDFFHSRGGADLRADERATVASAMKDRPAMLLKSSCMDWYLKLPVMVQTTLAARVAAAAPALEVEADGHAVGVPALPEPV